MKGAGLEPRSISSDEEQEKRVSISKTLSATSLIDPSQLGEEESDEHEDDVEVARDNVGELFAPGPMCSLKDTWERDKEDDSLQRWKQQLLGFAENELIEDAIEPDVKVVSLGIVCKDYPEIALQLPLDKKSNEVCFTLTEGSSYHLKFTFMVHHNIVCGLKYANTVWKGGIQVDQTQGMIGTFSPRREPYVFITEEDTTPKGLLARGFYTAKTKFMDDDGRCHLEIHYTFEIQKDWKNRKSHDSHKAPLFENKVYTKQWFVKNLSHQFASKRKKEKNQGPEEQRFNTH